MSCQLSECCCGLQGLPIEFRGLELLKELRLSGNNFTYLPDCMFPEIDGSIIVKPGMTNLRVLALDDNPLLGLDEVAPCFDAYVHM